jgi:hypothetical protein
MELRHRKIAFLVMAASGLALLVMMIVVEDEPGALPLILLLVGAVGYLYCSTRQRPSPRLNSR